MSVLWIIYFLIQENIYGRLMIKPFITLVQSPESFFQIMEQINNEIMSKMGQQIILCITTDLPQQKFIGNIDSNWEFLKVGLHCYSNFFFPNILITLIIVTILVEVAYAAAWFLSDWGFPIIYVYLHLNSSSFTLAHIENHLPFCMHLFSKLVFEAHRKAMATVMTSAPFNL